MLKQLLVFVLIGLFVVGCASTSGDSRTLLATSVATLPDYSYAGYKNGEQPLRLSSPALILEVERYGIYADDEIDDAPALSKLLAQYRHTDKPVVLQFDVGRYIIGDIVYVTRGNIVFRGRDRGGKRTEFYFPKPLSDVANPSSLKTVRRWFREQGKVITKGTRNLGDLYSQWSWNGGFFWVHVPGRQIKTYHTGYDPEPIVLATITRGKMGQSTFLVNTSEQLSVGQTIEIGWYNKRTENYALMKTLYGQHNLKIGERFYSSEQHPMSYQRVKIIQIDGNSLTIKGTLLHDAHAGLTASINQWNSISNVGFEHFKMTFERSESPVHHLEAGFNGIYMHDVYDGWVQDVQSEEADTAILAESSANITMKDVTVYGQFQAHYTVYFASSHNILVDNLVGDIPAVHAMCFNSATTRSVFINSQLKQSSILELHSGGNLQNLFENIELDVQLNQPEDNKYRLFKSGGAKYWKPAHGQYTTFFNIAVNFTNATGSEPIRLHGVPDGPKAFILGFKANREFAIDYRPQPFMLGIGSLFEDSLYQLQLSKRTSGQDD